MAAGGKCAADSYQVCDDSVPFCVSQEGDPDGFCSHECKAKSECQANASEKAAFACCASVSDGTRACLQDAYCAENVDTKASCDDVPGGSTYFGKCDKNVLIYCDGSTDTTQEVFCNKLGLECGWVDKQTGYSCVEPNSGALPEAPDDWCPYEEDGVCDAPEKCPDGTDLLDCKYCPTTDDGVCDEVEEIGGLCPPGTFVRLDNGDTAVVLRRSDKANHPLVASVIDAKGVQRHEPRLHQTWLCKPQVQSALARSASMMPTWLKSHATEPDVPNWPLRNSTRISGAVRFTLSVRHSTITATWWGAKPS